MSWSYSRALVAAYLGRFCSDIQLSARLNTMPTPDQFYWPDKTTEHSRLSRFGMMSEPLTAINGEALLMWFLADSRARTSALPEAGPDWTASGQGYGEKWHGLLARYDPATCSLKTVQLSLLEGLNESYLTLPRWGLMLDGGCYPQPTPALITSESVSGFWATPSATDGTRGGSITENMTGKSLAQQIKTPTRWPTPTVCGNYNRKGASATSGDGLATAVRTWPTPCASASKGSSQASLTRKSGKSRENDRLDHAVMSSGGGQLNPEWVEWLMGWPIGHTELKPLGTGRFQEFVQQHGVF